MNKTHHKKTIEFVGLVLLFGLFFLTRQAAAQLLLPTITIQQADITTTDTSIVITGTTQNFLSDTQAEIIYSTDPLFSIPETTSPFTISTSSSSPSITYTLSTLAPGTQYYLKIVDATNTSTVYVSLTPPPTTNYLAIDLTSGAQPIANCTEGPDGYCLLAPISGLTVIRNADLPNYFNLIYKIGIGLAAVLALIMLFFGGIQYMSTDALSGKEDGKKKMSNAILGLILALGSYAILNTINPKLLNFTFGIDSVSISINPDEIDNAIPSTPENGLYCPLQNNGQGYTDGSVWDQNLTADSALRSQLMGQNSISVSGGGCATVGQQSCTSLAGLDISGVLKIRDKCPTCELTITGGTECWLHSKKTAHGKNSTTIDLRNNASAPKLKAYVETAANLKGTISGWGKLYVVDGIEFVNEGDHYHVWGYNNEHAAKYPH
jgi:hypothetical protein